MDVELDGDVKTRNLPGIIAVDSIDVDWDNPQWLEAGLKYQLDDTNTLFLSAGWQEWSAFSSNTAGLLGRRGEPGHHPGPELGQHLACRRGTCAPRE